MLNKNFKGNEIFEVTRYYFKHGNENDELETTTTVWDSLEKAQAYIERYGGGVKFAGAEVEKLYLDREITCGDFKSGNYKIVAFQKVYDVTAEWVIDDQPGKVIKMNNKTNEVRSEEHGSTEHPAVAAVRDHSGRGGRNVWSARWLYQASRRASQAREIRIPVPLGREPP